MKVLVTGGTGFVGQEVVRALHLQHDVRVLVRNPEAPAAKRLEAEYYARLHRGDVLEGLTLGQAMHETDAVIHLVGIISEAGQQTFENLHVRATENIIKAARLAGTGRIVHMSALGTRSNANSRYHQTKWRAEQLVSESGMNWTIMRPSIIYGPHDHFVNLFARMAKFSPVLPVFGAGETKLQPVAVEDVAQCFAGALRQPRSYGQTLDVCGPERFTMPELLRIICRTINRKRPIAHIPMGIAWLMALYLEYFYKIVSKPSPLTRDQLLMLEEDNVGDSSLAMDMFNVRPTEFAQGIAAYLKPKGKGDLPRKAAK
jgi:NADH dehydrogenase